MKAGALCAAQCAVLRAAIDGSPASQAEVWDGDYRVDLDVRRTVESEVGAGAIAVATAVFDEFRREVEQFFAVRLTGREGPGFLRYGPGGFYRRHRDTLEEADEGWTRRVSVVLFLTTASAAPAEGHCVGGALRLHGDEGAFVDIHPVAGRVVAFPADVVHEVLPVVAGTRDVVVDWFY